MSTNSDSDRTQLVEMAKAVGAILGVPLALFAVTNSVIEQPLISLLVALIVAVLISVWVVLSGWANITQVIIVWLVLAVFVLAVFGFWPRTMTVEGIVYDPAGEPDTNVEVTLFDRSNKSYETRTNSAGFFQFIEVPIGKYRLRVQGREVGGEARGIQVRRIWHDFKVSSISPSVTPSGTAPIAYITLTPTPPSPTSTPMVPTDTSTPEPSVEPTRTNTPTLTSSPTPVILPGTDPPALPTPTFTSVPPTPTPTLTPEPPTRIPTDTPSPTIVPTNTPVPTLTPVPPSPMPTDTPSPIVPTNTPTNTPTNVPPEGACRAWEFETDGDTEGWVSGRYLSDTVARDGSLKSHVSAGDPFWVLPVANINADVYRVLEIRYLIDSSDSLMQFMWEDASDSFCGGCYIGFEIVTDNAWNTVTVELDNNYKWSGTVLGLRLDPVHLGSSGDTVEIDYIRICPP